MNKKLLCVAMLAGLSWAQAASAQEFDDRWYLTGSAGAVCGDSYRYRGRIHHHVPRLMFVR